MQPLPIRLATTRHLAWRPPSLCAICHGWGRQRVCDPCWSAFAPSVARCLRCALTLAPASSTSARCGRCLASPPAFDAAVARTDYRPPWERVVADFKFHGAMDLAGTLATGLAEAVGDDPGVDLVLPVPLARERMRQRGCNQAWELARRVASQLHVSADAGLLLRIRETAHQLDLPPDRRAANVRGAFAIEPTRLAEVRGRRIAVVDDVMTTGSTLGETATVLKQAGATEVRAWVFARTPPPGDN